MLVKIKADEIKTAKSLPFKKLVDALERGFALGCVQPERQHLKMEKNDQTTPIMLIMPAWSKPEDDKQYLGVKIVNIYPDNRLKNLPGLTSTYILYNGKTGEELAILDGNTLTARRTAATSALAARYLSLPQSKKLAIIGAGKVAQLLAEAFSVVRPIEEITLWNRTKDYAFHLAEKLGNEGFSVKIADSVEEAVANADIVSAATLSTEPLIRKKWLKHGTHVDLIGAFAPHMRESDDDLVSQTKLYIDTPEAIDETGDLCVPIKQGIIARTDILATLSELVTAKKRVSRDENDITLFKAVGSALADLYAAKLGFETMISTR